MANGAIIAHRLVSAGIAFQDIQLIATGHAIGAWALAAVVKLIVDRPTALASGGDAQTHDDRSGIIIAGGLMLVDGESRSLLFMQFGGLLKSWRV